MAENNIIVAFELGPSKIAGVAAQKNPDGSLKIKAYAHKDSGEFIRKGTVSNVDKTVAALKEIKQQLEATLQQHVKSAYVGLSGLSMRSEKNTISRQFGMEEKHITPEIIDDIIEKNSKNAKGDEEILNVIIQEYQTATTQTLDPIGALTSRIQGNFLNILSRTSLRANIERCFNQADIQVIEYLVGPEATAAAALNAVEQRSGCALVDIGAETTAVTIYRNSILRYLRILPLGSAAITRDLCKLPNIALEEEDAEKVKLKYGTALPTAKSGTNVLGGDATATEEYATLSNGRTVSLDQVALFTAARAEEIIANAWEQIKNSGYESELMGGIVLTGGGSNLDRIDELMQRYAKRNCHIASTLRSNLKVSGYPVNTGEGVDLTLVGLLNAGTENCCTEMTPEEPEETPEQPAPDTAGGGKASGGQTYTAGTTIKPGQEGKKESEEKEPKKTNFKERFFNWINGVLDDDK